MTSQRDNRQHHRRYWPSSVEGEGEPTPGRPTIGIALAEAIGAGLGVIFKGLAWGAGLIMGMIAAIHFARYLGWLA